MGYDRAIVTMHSAQGIILRREDFRERDEKVVLYTKEFGKISIVAKGTKRIGAKLRGNLDIFNFVDIIFVEGRNFFILTNIDTREKFSNIIKNPHIYGAALSVTEMTWDIFQEMARDEEFFEALRSTLTKLNKYGGDELSGQESSLYSWLILKKFQSILLGNQGYSMNISEMFSQSGKKLSKSSVMLLEMFDGADHSGVRLSQGEIWDIERVFFNTFEYIFNYTPSLWIPVTQ